MAEIINCPECSRKVSVPERLLGKTVRCPSCKATFTADAPVEEELEVVEEEAPRRPPKRPSRAADDEDEDDRPVKRRPRPVEEEDEPPRRRRRDEDEELEEDRPRKKRRDEDDDYEEDRPRRRRRDEEDEDEEDESRPRRKRIKLSGDTIWGWKRVRFGIMFVLAAAVVAVLANVGGVVGIKAMAEAGPAAAGGGGAAGIGPSMATGTIVLLICYYLACTSSVGLSIAGQLICSAVPEPKAARSTLTSSVIMMGIGLFLFLGGAIYFYVRLKVWASNLKPETPTAPPLEGLLIYIGGATLLLAEPGVFSLFLRNAAQEMREDGLALSILFQAIAAGLIALVFVISAMGQYSAIHGLMGAVEGRSRAGVDEAGDVSGTVLKVLYFVAIAYTAWFITSIILTRLAITKHIQRR